MRDSGVVWLGEVPKGWDVLRGRQLFEIKKTISGELDRPVISVTQEGLRVKDVESGEGQLSQDYSKYQTVEVGEFAMNSMDLLTGGVGIATTAGVTSPDYRVFSVRDKSRVCDRYMLQVLRMLYRNRAFYGWGQGSAQLGRWRLPRRRFNDFPFPVPSFTEQTAIARFLDWANGRLERAIQAKKKLISLLNEKKQAVIHQAVTRGIDCSVPLKPSGVPWLGDIPQHWEVKKLRFLFRYSKGRRAAEITNEYIGRHIGLFPVYSGQTEADGLMGNIDWYEFDFDAPVIFVSTVGARAMSTRLIQGKFSLSQNCALIIPRTQDANPVFYESVLKRLFAYERRSISLIMQPSLRFADLNRFYVPHPPRCEQLEIMKELLDKTAKLDASIRRIEREIELLREYRARLIADVVTGKLDVRAAARNLPAEGEVTSHILEGEPIDEDEFIGEEQQTA
jgi:type I restriction enzyme S subunit